VGCISVTSNVVPKLCAALQNAWAAGDFGKVTTIQKKLAAINDVLFVETNPTPAKYALSLMGRIKAEMRLPLVPLSEANQGKIKAVLRELDLI
jgi:4-hydroxy-tetrahydrodipicolinate synthase